MPRLGSQVSISLTPSGPPPVTVILAAVLAHLFHAVLGSSFFSYVLVHGPRDPLLSSLTLLTRACLSLRRWDDVRHQTVSLLAAFLTGERGVPAPVDLQNFVAFQDGFDKLFKNVTVDEVKPLVLPVCVEFRFGSTHRRVYAVLCLHVVLLQLPCSARYRARPRFHHLFLLARNRFDRVTFTQCARSDHLFPTGCFFSTISALPFPPLDSKRPGTCRSEPWPLSQARSPTTHYLASSS